MRLLVLGMTFGALIALVPYQQLRKPAFTLREHWDNAKTFLVAWAVFTATLGFVLALAFVGPEAN